MGPAHLDSSLVAILLVALSFVTALSLFVTLRVARFVAETSAEPEALVPLAGQPAPPLWPDERAEDSEPRATVLALLSPGCPDCRAKVPEIAEMLPAAAAAGVALWVVPADGVYPLAALLAGTPLVERERKMEPDARSALNPLGAAPLYVFIAADGIVQAGGYIGDEDWRSFLYQMREA